MSQPVAPIVPAQVAFDGTTPISTRHGDGYFMRGQGLAESQSVFIEASNLRQRFSALQANQVFVVGETGFGSGLNMLLAARAFIEHAPGSAFLHLQSVELHPLGSADLKRTLAQWPELNDLGQRLLTDYPPAVPGWHRLRLAPNISLTLMLGDATEQWQQADISVDAWFLDGFAPARNPDMWQPPLL
ncbi:MAG: amino acid oxidase, partial [Wenzhouxiangella sp.]